MSRILAASIAVLILTGCSSAPNTYSGTSASQQAESDEPEQAVITPAYPGWENFGEWHVKAIHGDMDLVTHVRLFTRFFYSPSNPVSRLPGQDSMSFGFEIFGDEVVVLSPGAGFLGRGSWPYCDYDLSSLSVDDSKAVALTPVASPGSCRAVALNGEAVQKMLAGNTARVKLGGMEGTFFLDGFKEAWVKARELGKK